VVSLPVGGGGGGDAGVGGGGGGMGGLAVGGHRGGRVFFGAWVGAVRVARALPVAKVSALVIAGVGVVSLVRQLAVAASTAAPLRAVHYPRRGQHHPR